MAKILYLMCPTTATLSQPIASMLEGLATLSSSNNHRAEILLLGAGHVLAQQAACRAHSTAFYVSHPALETYQPDVYVAAACAAAAKLDPDLIVLPTSPRESELAPRLAARMNTGLASECVKLLWSEHGFRLFRPVFGGKAITEVEVLTRPAIATVRIGAFRPSDRQSAQQAEVRALEVDVDPAVARSKPLDTLNVEGEGDLLEDAKVIVSGGRGLGGPAPFEQLRDLATLLQGSVGASRAAVDSGWVPTALQIGQTGKTVSPHLYLAVGISGASQHIAGIGGAKHVVAINNDADAPIFDVAELGVVADWNAIIPPLIAQLRQRLG